MRITMGAYPSQIKLIGGRYKVVRQIGSGSFSEVYLCSGTDSYVAVKLLKQKFTPEALGPGDPAFEAQVSLLKRLKHHNIAQLLDCGLDAELHRFYFVTELVVGPNIYDATKDRGLDFITGLFLQTAHALEYLHSYRLFHLDLKAANLLVTQVPEPQVKLIDYELASIGSVKRPVGTPSYMAPELIEKGEPNDRTDLYALGVLLYYCLTRQNPFRANGIEETLKRHENLIPPPPSGLKPGIPAPLDHLVMKLLNKDPQGRFDSARSLIEEFYAHWPLLKYSENRTEKDMKVRIHELEEQVQALSQQLTKAYQRPTPFSVSEKTGPDSEIKIDSLNHYNPSLEWYHYEHVIIAKAFEANQYEVRPTATMLGLAVTTVYKKVKELGLLNRRNPLYQVSFQYTPRKKLAEYIPEVFKAALSFSHNKPYTAIAQLKVSQGYFYKILNQYKLR